MDRHFLELWGNLLINAAKGQKQIEELTQLLHQGKKGFEGQNATFRKFYGLNSLTEESPDYPKAWQNAADDFQKSLKEYLNLMGVVRKDEHLKLVGKYEDLKKKAADQEETIKHLRMLLDEKGIAQGEVPKGFQDLIRKQTDQFQDLMKGFGHFHEKDPSSTDGDNNNS
ncbi:MAG: hypothetical protein ISS63_00395 [Desulfobacteraceae bacterium]|nr:hypothetical protein [Desulfobacteraceae bacterium]